MIKKIIKDFVLIILFSWLIYGCYSSKSIESVSVTSKIYHLYQKDFKDFPIPNTYELKNGVKKKIPYANFDEVWDAAILVLMQNGIILQTSKELGIIVIIGDWPLAVFVEKSEPITVYMNILEDLYTAIDYSKNIKLRYKPPYYKQILKEILDKIAVQVYVTHKWKYLK